MLKRVDPYGSFDDAMRALDNGGAFLDVFARKGDGVVVGSELAKAAGAGRKAIMQALFLDVALSALDSEHRDAVRSRLEPRLRRRMEAARPEPMSPGKFEKRAEPGRAYVVLGDAVKPPGGNGVGLHRRRDAGGRFPGAGLQWDVPILPDYEVVYVRDDSARSSAACDVLVHRTSSPLLRGRVRIAGVAATYVFSSNLNTNRPPWERTFLLPAYVASLG